MPKGVYQRKNGYKHSEETKKKISKKMKGKKPYEMTDEIRKKMSIARIGKFGGENSFSWKGGAIYYRIKQAKIRDDYTCQICGLRDPEIMEVDHVKPKSLFPELANDLNNMVVLCPNCHKRKTNRERKMKLYSPKKGREQLEQYLNELIK